MGGAHGSGIGLRSGSADGFEEFGARDGGGAAFHHDEAASDVGEVRGFEGRGAAGEAEGVGGENGVTGAGDVDGLIAAVDGNVGSLLAGLEEGDAVTAAGDEERLQLHFGESGAAAAFEFGEIFPDGGVMEGFHFAFVGSGGVETGTGVGGQMVTGIERGDGALAAGEEFAEFGGDGDAETIVGNGDGIGFFDRAAKLGVNLFVDAGGERLIGFIVHPEDLLADFVGPSGEEAGLGGRGPAFGGEDAGNVDFFRAEKFAQAVAGLVLADGGDGNYLGSERGEIVGGIGAAAGYDLGFAMLEDQDRGFTGDAGDVAELKGVGDEIPEDDDGFGGETLDVFGEGKQVYGGRGGAFDVRADHEGSLNRM